MGIGDWLRKKKAKGLVEMTVGTISVSYYAAREKGDSHENAFLYAVAWRFNSLIFGSVSSIFGSELYARFPDSDVIEIFKEAGAYEKIEYAGYIIGQMEQVTFPGYVGWYSERIGWDDPKVKLCESILKTIYKRGLIEQAKNHAIRMGMRLESI